MIQGQKCQDINHTKFAPSRLTTIRHPLRDSLKTPSAPGTRQRLEKTRRRPKNTQARALREQGLGEHKDAEYQTTTGTQRLLIFPSAGVTLNEQLLKK